MKKKKKKKITNSTLSCPNQMTLACFCASQGPKAMRLPVSALTQALEYWQMGTQLHRKQKRNCYAACGSTGKT